MFIKLKGPEISIATANTVSDATAVRIYNTGAAAVCNVAYSNGTVYANATVSNTEALVIVKSNSDTVIGPNMRAAPVEFRG